MAGFRRRINCALSGVFSEKRLFIQSDGGTRYFRITPLSQLMIGTTALAAAGWMAVATASVVSDFVATDARGGAAVELREAYQARLDELADERDTRAAEAHSAQGRFRLAMDQVSRQQTELLAAIEERRELSTALDLMRDRLRSVVAQRDSANTKLLAEAKAGESGDDLDETLRAVSGRLNDVAGARDLAETERARLAEQVADLRLRAEVNTRRQAEMMDQIDQAVAMSFGPMQKVFAEANIDVDSLLAKVRADYSGEGGPLSAPVMSSRNYDDGATSRFDTMMVSIDRMNLMRIAAGKVPLAVPVHDTFRFTSGFGVRTDPKGRGRRKHAGVDFAAPKGTPILATADGVVVAAERESGYGNVVRIRHELGFETVYAHQSKIRVHVGQRVSRGEQIGDMGSTGRSTGVHLHYEVHVNGTAVDPMTFLEAAKDVF
ncbi:DUF5930 domain-containing protein [uncultured Amaricoccus sp.]|uniref:DUF5930 domain-containing protein n=1 Tax=uncultured Amaricoccus sp. TaxID=339341 RepID=UPI0026181B6F|nr:DUF5930 domain-containing protein [uncultured Amaricoccus sp.]